MIPRGLERSVRSVPPDSPIVGSQRLIFLEFILRSHVRWCLWLARLHCMVDRTVRRPKAGYHLVMSRGSWTQQEVKNIQSSWQVGCFSLCFLSQPAMPIQDWIINDLDVFLKETISYRLMFILPCVSLHAALRVSGTHMLGMPSFIWERVFCFGFPNVFVSSL